MPAINFEPKAFSLLVYTDQLLRARLFLKKSRTSPHSPVKRRSGNAWHSQVISER
jgi:hypothetical protein